MMFTTSDVNSTDRTLEETFHLVKEFIGKNKSDLQMLSCIPAKKQYVTMCDNTDTPAIRKLVGIAAVTAIRCFKMVDQVQIMYINLSVYD